MFGIGFTELLVIAVVAIVVVGPKRLPEVMRQAGKFFVHMRRTANDVRASFDNVVRQAEDEIRREEAAARQSLLTEARPVNAGTGNGSTPAADGHGGAQGETLDQPRQEDGRPPGPADAVASHLPALEPIGPTGPVPAPSTDKR